MKEFAMKHPILTFLLADSLIAGVVNIIGHVTAAFGKNTVVEEKTIEVAEEEKTDDDASDSE